MTCTVCSAVLDAPASWCPVCGSPAADAAGALPGVAAALSVRASGSAAEGLLGLAAVSAVVLTARDVVGGGANGIVLPKAASWVMAAGLVLAVLAFLEWFSRVRHNAGLWGPQRRRQGWALGAWFTPGVNLWFPYQIAADAVTPRQVGGTESRVTLGLVRAWWTCWVLALVTNVRVHYGTRGTPPGFSRGVAFGIGFGKLALGVGVAGTVAGGVFAALSALLAMRMVSRLTAAQSARISPAPMRSSLIHAVPGGPEAQAQQPGAAEQGTEPVAAADAEPPAPAG